MVRVAVGTDAGGDLEPSLEGEPGLTVGEAGTGGPALTFSAGFTGVRGIIPLQKSFLLMYFLL